MSRLSRTGDVVSNNRIQKMEGIQCDSVMTVM